MYTTKYTKDTLTFFFVISLLISTASFSLLICKYIKKMMACSWMRQCRCTYYLVQSSVAVLLLGTGPQLNSKAHIHGGCAESFFPAWHRHKWHSRAYTVSQLDSNCTAILLWSVIVPLIPRPHSQSVLVGLKEDNERGVNELKTETSTNEEKQRKTSFVL